MKKIFPFAFALMLLLSSCGGLVNQLSVAMDVAEYFNTRSVNVSTVNGQTKLTFSNVPAEGWDEAGVQMVSNMVVLRYVNAIGEKEFKGEKSITVLVEMTGGTSYSNDVPIEEIAEKTALIKIADKMVENCIAENNTQMSLLCDPFYLPDSSLAGVTKLSHRVNEGYGKPDKTPRAKGFYNDTAADYPDLKMLTIVYPEVQKGKNIRYTVSVDKSSRKVVYIGLNAD